MSTTIRPEITKKSEYWIDKHRYYELKHFCLQYPLWKQEYANLNGYIEHYTDGQPKAGSISKPVENIAEKRLYYAERITMVEDAALNADKILGLTLLRAVTEGISYDSLRAADVIPCCKDFYYNIYRKFFWLLDKSRK